MSSTPSQDNTTGTGSSSTTEKNPNGVYTKADYTPVEGNWFTAKPYGFRFTDKNGKSTTIFLPIGPSNLTISTSFATNVVSTLYGVVEEHSPIRFYDISIEGTTGMAPKYVDPVANNGIPKPQLGRSTFKVNQTIDAKLAKGFFSSGIAAQTAGKAKNIVNDTKALFGQTDEMISGLYVDQTGYIAFHNLYRFLLKYKKDASGSDSATKGVTRGEDKDGNSEHPLIFFNYKDCNQYNVVIRSFVLRRDKEDPMLYNYSINMRGYALSAHPDATRGIATKTDQDMLVDLGLDGVDGSTYLGKAKQNAASAKNILGSVASGINLFGR